MGFKDLEAVTKISAFLICSSSLLNLRSPPVQHDATRTSEAGRGAWLSLAGKGGLVVGPEPRLRRQPSAAHGCVEEDVTDEAEPQAAGRLPQQNSKLMPCLDHDVFDEMRA